MKTKPSQASIRSLIAPTLGIAGTTSGIAPVRSATASMLETPTAWTGYSSLIRCALPMMPMTGFAMFRGCK